MYILLENLQKKERCKVTETCCNITPFHIKDENKEKLSKTIIYADEKALDALGENRKVNVELGRPGKSYIIRRYIIGNNIIYMKNNTITEILKKR